MAIAVSQHWQRHIGQRLSAQTDGAAFQSRCFQNIQLKKASVERLKRLDSGGDDTRDKDNKNTELVNIKQHKSDDDSNETQRTQEQKQAAAATVVNQCSEEDMVMVAVEEEEIVDQLPVIDTPLWPCQVADNDMCLYRMEKFSDICLLLRSAMMDDENGTVRVQSLLGSRPHWDIQTLLMNVDHSGSTVLHHIYEHKGNEETVDNIHLLILERLHETDIVNLIQVRNQYGRRVLDYMLCDFRHDLNEQTTHRLSEASWSKLPKLEDLTLEEKQRLLILAITHYKECGQSLDNVLSTISRLLYSVDDKTKKFMIANSVGSAPSPAESSALNALLHCDNHLITSYVMRNLLSSKCQSDASLLRNVELRQAYRLSGYEGQISPVLVFIIKAAVHLDPADLIHFLLSDDTGYAVLDVLMAYHTDDELNVAEAVLQSVRRCQHRVQLYKAMTERTDSNGNTILHRLGQQNFVENFRRLYLALQPEQQTKLANSLTEAGLPKSLSHYLSSHQHWLDKRQSREYCLQNPCQVIIYYSTVDRINSKEEAQSIIESFAALGAMPEVLVDGQSHDLLTAIQKKQSWETSCLVVVVMSHGKAGHIQFNDRYLSIDELMRSMCGAVLETIPKVLIVQACQAKDSDLDRGHQMLDACGVTGTSRDGLKCREHFTVTHSDVAVLLATGHGMTAQRNLVIPLLARNLKETGGDLWDSWMKSSREVEECVHINQIPVLVSTLRRKLVLSNNFKYQEPISCSESPKHQKRLQTAQGQMSCSHFRLSTSTLNLVCRVGSLFRREIMGSLLRLTC